MKRIVFALLAALFVSRVDAAGKKHLLFDYTFTKNPGVLLHNNAEIANNVLKLDGKSCATIPDSSAVHLTEKGLTLIITAKLREKVLPDPRKRAGYDMFFSKDKEFIFGRYGNKLYVNFHDGKKWAATTLCAAPVVGEWAQYAATFEHYSDRAQGEEGYIISIYLNGELELARRVPWTKPKLLQKNIQIGTGFGGGPWFLNGEIARAKIYQGALNDAYIAEEFAKDKLVKKVRKGFFEVQPALQRDLAGLERSGKSYLKWLAKSFRRAAGNGLDQKKLQNAVSVIRKYSVHSSAEQFAKSFNQAQNDYRIIITPYQTAVCAVGNGKGNHPLLGLYDRIAKREIFGDRTISWQIRTRQNKKFTGIDSHHPAVRWNSYVHGNKLIVKWNVDHPFRLEGMTELIFQGKRLESSCMFRSLAADRIIDEIVYPEYNFARISKKNDALAYPYMSGIEVKNPTRERFKYGQSGCYPSGFATMQFGAYYDDNCGIYYGFEDGLGRTKILDVSGKRDQLYVQWTHKVGLPAGKNGANSFVANGKAVLEFYGKGRWYQAGQIYRKFAQKASWWIKDLPRKSTPSWFRNNNLWILCAPNTKQAHEIMRDQLIALRKYFGQSFGIHWYGWDDSTIDLGWPHFPAKKFVPEINKQIRQAGIYTIPYIDNRLWAVKDGPQKKGSGEKTDYMFTSHGKKYAAKDLNGKYYTETYSKNKVFAIICPAVKGWQDFMTRLVVRLAQNGFDGVYHDQVGTGAPRMCYDPSHGHDLNGGNVWLEQGYYVMFDKMFQILQKKFPDFCHTTEENADVYLKQFDGYMVWRWTEGEQIPLFQSIYSGRTQFVGRLFDHQKRGDRQSFFSKVGQQLVNAEQIGWFTIRCIAQPDAKRLYVKKTMYIRNVLLDYFNAGQMLPPVSWKSMPTEKSLWGGNSVNMVFLPKIANSAWQGADNSRMWLFTNTQEKEAVTAVPQISSSKGFWICREGASEPVFSKIAQTVRLKRLCSEVWIEGPRAVADRIQATMKQIASFNAGKKLPHTSPAIPKIKKILPGVSGRLYTAKDIVSLSGGTKADNNSHVGWLDGETFLTFGTVDFGKKGAETIAVRITVAPDYAGGTLDILCSESGKKHRKVGSLTLKSTGGWNHYQEIPVKLNKRLTGRQHIVFHISGRAACNFAGWRYLVK